MHFAPRVHSGAESVLDYVMPCYGGGDFFFHTRKYFKTLIIFDCKAKGNDFVFYFWGLGV